jgi:hypothetical protein
MTKNTIYFTVFLLTLICLISCKPEPQRWDKIAKSLGNWKSYDLQIKGIKAPFSSIPVSKTKAFNKDINFYENYAEIDSVTFSVAIITNSSLKNEEDWTNFLNKEVLAFEALERKNIKVQGRNAVLSKMRISDLCSYTINMVVDNKFVVNIGIRYKGAFPPEKLIMDYASGLKIEKYQLPSLVHSVNKDSVPLQPEQKEQNLNMESNAK